jgi:hypothetical protein
MLKKLMSSCGCINVKYLVILFFILAIFYSMYGNEVNSMITGEDCDCKS